MPDIGAHIVVDKVTMNVYVRCHEGFVLKWPSCNVWREHRDFYLMKLTVKVGWPMKMYLQA